MGYLKKIKLIGEQKNVLFLPVKKPILIKGVAGSGKTTVAIYRAKHLLDTQSNLFQQSNVAIFTYNKTLANYLKELLPHVRGGYSKDSDEIKPVSSDGLNVTVVNFHKWAYDFAGIKYSEVLDNQKEIIESIKNTLASLNSNINNSILSKNSNFFKDEISWIKGKLLNTKEEYLAVKRMGRGTSDRVTEKDKEIIWEVYQKYDQYLKSNGMVDFDDYAIKCLQKIENDPYWKPPFTHIVVDEAQDLNKAQILVISKLVSKETESITIIADVAQRIYKSGFSWYEVGINIRGNDRSIELRRNYRNSAHIARVALSLLKNEEDDSEFTHIKDARKQGEKPIVGYFEDFYKQLDYLKRELQSLKKRNQISSTVVLHRTNKEARFIQGYLNDNGFQTYFLKNNDTDVNFNDDSIKICTMSSIKGLEFNNVFIMDLTDDVIPSPSGFSEPNDKFHISTERRLLYTCITRAITGLYLIGSKNNPSRFLAEIDGKYLNNIS